MADKRSMWSSPRRSVLASVAAGCCLAASVVAGGYAASGAMPFSEWPGALFASSDARGEVALAPPKRADAPVLTIPAPSREKEATRVIPLRRATTDTTTRTRIGARRTTTSFQRTQSRTRRTTATPDTSPTSAPTGTSTATTPAPTAAPAADTATPPTPSPVATAATKKVKLADVSSTFASASDSGSGQPELRVQMAVADQTAATPTTKTVALSLKLAPTDLQALRATAAAVGSAPIALETEVDVVDASVVTTGQPACTDGQCLRVQMKFAQDTRPNPVDGPEVQVLDDGDALSNRVKVVVKIDPEDLGNQSGPVATAPDAPPPVEAGTPTVLALPLPAAADPATTPPTTDSARVALPDADPAAGTPDAPAVQVQAQLQVVDAPAPGPTAPDPTAPDAAAPDATAPTSGTDAQPSSPQPGGDCK